MQIVLDESLPVRLASAISGHRVTTVRRLGWLGVRNGELLRRAAREGFDVLMTVDRSLRYQQDVAQSGLAVVVLRAPTNRLEDLLPLMPAVLRALPTLKAGQLIEIGAE